MAERRSYRDRREYLINAVHKRRKEVRRKALEYKGAHCECCGYDRCMEALEFHHLTSTRKDFGISSKGYTEAGKKSEKNWTSANSFARTVTEKCTPHCSPHGRLWVKNRVNSGKPSPHYGTGILSEACRRAHK